MSKSKQTAETEPEVRSFDASGSTGQNTSSVKRYASKETVNLCMKDKKDISAESFCLYLALILLFLIVLEFFFAYRPYKKLEEAEAAFAQEQAEYQQLVDSMTDYDQVREDYRKYNYENFDRTIVDREDILEMLKEVVYPMGKVQSLSITRNTITMSLATVLTTDIDVMQNKVREHKLVQNVIISRTNLEGNLATVNMTILLKDAE